MTLKTAAAAFRLYRSGSHGPRLRAVRACQSLSLTSLGSNLASVTDWKRIQTLHSLCFGFGGYKTWTPRWSGGSLRLWEFKFESKFWAWAESPRPTQREWSPSQSTGTDGRVCCPVSGSSSSAKWEYIYYDMQNMHQHWYFHVLHTRLWQCSGTVLPHSSWESMSMLMHIQVFPFLHLNAYLMHI